MLLRTQVKILAVREYSAGADGSMSRLTQPYAVKICVTAVFAALIAALTFLIRVPVPATGGYINFGDTIIFISALLFGRFVGGIAGGVGSAIADVIGYPLFAPFTLVVKGLEGFLAGQIRSGTSLRRDITACVVGGVVMVLGYFIVEAYILMLGIPAALVEVPGNVSQMLVGGVIGVPVVQL